MSYRFSLRISVAHFCHWKMTKSWTLSFHSLPMKWPALNQSLKEINACRPCTNSQDSAIQPDTTTSFNFFPRWDYSRQIISLLELYPIVSVSSIWEKKYFCGITFFYNIIRMVTMKGYSWSAIILTWGELRPMVWRCFSELKAGLHLWNLFLIQLIYPDIYSISSFLFQSSRSRTRNNTLNLGTVSELHSGNNGMDS